MYRPLFKISSLLFVCFLMISVNSHAAVDCHSAYQWSANGKFLKDDYVRNNGLLYKAKRNASTEKPDPANTSGPWEYRGVCAAYYKNVTVQCDFNGDGQMDLAKGLPFSELVGAIVSNPNVRENANYYSTGEVLINYGNTSPDTPPNQVWNQNGLGMFPYARPFASFGQVLATGDFNNDNFCDLAISAPLFSIKGGTQFSSEGVVNILYGSPNGLTTVVLGENGRPINPYDAQRFDQDTPGIPEKAEAYDSFGYAMASGDFNGDGYDDLAVGSPAESVVVVPQLGNLSSAGYFNIIYGSKRGLQTSAPAAVGYFQHLAGVPLFEVEEGDLYAKAMAAADFDNDGYADIVVAAPGEDEASGKITLLRGSPTGLDISSRKDFILNNFKPGADSSYAQFGKGLRAVDFNADGFKDLEIDFYDNSATGSNFFATMQVKGSASGLIINH